MQDGDLIIGIMASLGRTDYTVGELLALTRPFNVTPVSLRTNLSRLKKKGVLVARPRFGKPAYAFAAKGAAITANVALAFSEPDWSGWDGTFWGVLLNLAAGDKKGRYRIAKKLTLYRFAAYAPGFWVRPFHAKEQIERKLETIFQDGRCRLIRFHPHTTVTRAEAAALWDIAGAGTAMRAAQELAERALERGRDLPPQAAFVARLATGERIIAALFRDPLLPRTFLPASWPAPALRKLFGKFDAAMDARSRPFRESIVGAPPRTKRRIA
jgi:phenylacetic acid degradation operon negative regulatory protein